MPAGKQGDGNNTQNPADKRLEILNRIALAVSSEIDIGSLCSRIGEILAEIFRTETVYIAIASEDRTQWETPFLMSDGVRTELPLYRYGAGLTSVVMDRKSPLLIQNDTENTLNRLGSIRVDKKSPKSWLGVPLLWNGEAFGVLSVQNLETEGFFTPEDVSMLESIAATAAGALAGARTANEAARRAMENRVLLEISRELTSSLEYSSVLSVIAERAWELLTRDTSAVYIMDQSTGTLSAVAVKGISAAEVQADTVRLGEGIVGTVAQSGVGEIVNDTYNDSRGIHLHGTPEDRVQEKLLATPLSFRNSVLGVLAVWRGTDETGFLPADLSFCEALASFAAIAVHNARLYGRAMAARLEAEEASRVKSRFLAAMSHELNAPVNAVLNYSMLLAEGLHGSLSDAQQSMLRRVEGAGRQLATLVDQVLDMARIEAGKLELVIEATDVQTLLAEAAAEAGSSAVLNVPQGLRPIAADRARLRKALASLLAAAQARSETAAPVVSASPAQDGVEIRIAMEGRGIELDDIDRAMAEYGVLDSGRKDGGKPSAISLPLARRLIELHGSALRQETDDRGRSSLVLKIREAPGG
ncbi:MAG: GAF domain-containing sensor histidine kinase [Spirochaetia bacterium]|nr:GAF domain-containing sensor histidine kinase [Spirochaetia bacterium]